MRLFALIDRSVPGRSFLVIAGPDRDVIAWDGATGTLATGPHRVIKLGPDRVIDLGEWPVTFGVIRRIPPHGVNLTMIVHDLWDGTRSHHHFAADQHLLDKRVAFLRAEHTNAADIPGPPPTWISRHLADLIAGA